jgi:hypothetical protein
MKISQKIDSFKKMTLKTNFGCQSYVLFKKGIKCNQSYAPFKKDINGNFVPQSVCLPPKPLFFLAKNFNTTTHKNKQNFEKKQIQNFTRLGPRSRFSCLENASFLFVYDLLRFHKAKRKECYRINRYMQTLTDLPRSTWI